MRALIYGAGVLGGFLAHNLMRAPGADVALLARGAWADSLERDGLRICHYAQRKTTVDRPRVIRELAPDDAYDLVFVVVQARQVPGVLPALAANASPRVVFVGNDADCLGVAAALPGKEVAFAFQSSAGKREDGQIVAAYLKRSMTVGGAAGELGPDFSSALEGALGAAGYVLDRQDQMDAWLKWHVACVLPLAFVSYACDCDLRRATKGQLDDYLTACGELAGLFGRVGIPVVPEGDEKYFEPGPKLAFMRLFYKLLFKTRLGELCVTDHCRHAREEMDYLAEQLEGRFPPDEFRQAAPTYLALKAAMPTA